MLIELNGDLYLNTPEVNEALQTMANKSPKFKKIVEVITAIRNSETLVMYQRKNIDALIKFARDSEGQLESVGATCLLDSLENIKETTDYQSWRGTYYHFISQLGEVGLGYFDPLSLIEANPYVFIVNLIDIANFTVNECRFVNECIQSIQEYKVEKRLFPFLGNRLYSGEVLVSGQNLDDLKLKFIDEVHYSSLLSSLYDKVKQIESEAEELNDLEDIQTELMETKNTVFKLYSESSILLDVDSRELVYDQIKKQNDRLNELDFLMNTSYGIINQKEKEIQNILAIIEQEISLNQVKTAGKSSKTVDEFKIRLLEESSLWEFSDWLIMNNYMEDEEE